MTARLTFDAAADRLDRLVRDVKEKQFGDTGAKGIAVPPPSWPGVPPDAAWMNTYATRSIRPRGRQVPPIPAFHAPQTGQPPQPLIREPADGGTIGAVLGKPVKKRGALARLFSSRNR